MTKQRSLILRVLRDSHQHLTASEICVLARQTMPTLAVGTVYRNLNLLAEQAQVLRIRTAGRPDRFDAATEEHEHLICTRCGKLTDAFLPDLHQLLTRRTGTPILSYRLELYHICPECMEKEKQK